MTEQEEFENKLWQQTRIIEYYNEMPIAQFKFKSIEADDIIAHLCQMPELSDHQKIVVSSDKDFFQLLDDKTVLYRPIQKEILNKNSIWYSSIKKISHFPNNGWWNYLDWVSLMNYDNDLGLKHATYESVFGKDGSLNYWIKFGIPETKIVTGLPFYGRAGWGEDWLFYKDIFNKTLVKK